MIRILHIGMSTNPGGVENFVMNVYRKLDRSKIQFDFLVDHDYPKIAYEDEIVSLGGKVYREYYRRKEVLKPNRKSVKQFFKEHPEISGVHMHANTLNPMFRIIEIAKKCNIPIRILHSHNSGYMTKVKTKDFLYEKYAKLKLKSTTHLLACSEQAGQWMFGKEKYSVLNNSIEIKKYVFDEKERKDIREQLDIKNDDILVGTVTRLNYQKNPLFMAKIYAELVKLNNHYKLLIVGDGELKKELEEFFKKEEIRENVIFVGKVENVTKYLSAMDIFLFSSRFEGFGIALLEAQVSGLTCYASNVVPKEIKCSENLNFLSLEENEEQWANTIHNSKLNEDRNIDLDLFEEYSLEANISKIEKIYNG